MRYVYNNKFEKFKSLNNVFKKWRFYYRRYINQVGYFKRGFYKEFGLNNSQPSINKTKDLTKLAFWFLDLTDKGYSYKLKEEKRLFNVEWELVRGEYKFVELYGDLENLPLLEVELLQDRLKDSIVKYFWEKHDIVLSSDELNDISFSKVDLNKKKFLKVSFCNDKFEKFFESESTNGTSQGLLKSNLHSYFYKDMYLSKNKKYFTDLDLSTDPMRISLLRQRGFLDSFDEIELYINTFGYTRNTGKSNIDIYNNLVQAGHQQARFKLLPTFVENLDDPDLIHPGFGFQNYIQIFDRGDLNLLKFFLLNSKMFMPGSAYKTERDSPIFLNYFNFRNMTQLNSSVDIHISYQKVKEQICTSFEFSSSDENFFHDYVEVSYIQSLSENIKSPCLIGESQTIGGVDNQENFWFFYIFFSLFNYFLFFDPTRAFASSLIDHFMHIKRESQDVLVYDTTAVGEIQQGLTGLVLLTYDKRSFFLKNYSAIVTLDGLFLQRWHKKLRDLFLLRADLPASWGYYLDVIAGNGDGEDDGDKGKEDIEEDDALLRNTPFTLERAYKLFVENVRNPNIVRHAMRPYKWLSIPGLQYSPFFYLLNNVRSLWFYIFDQNIGLFSFIRNGAKFENLKEKSDLLHWMTRLVFLRYFLKDDVGYNILLKYLYSSKFFSRMFGSSRSVGLDFKFFVDKLLLSSGFSKNFQLLGNIYLEKFLKEHSNILPAHFYKDLPQFTLYRLFNFYRYFMYGSSGFFELDWQTDLRKANQTRIPMLSKIGLSPEHFHFFSFFSRDFFEDAVAYKAWMKMRTFDTPYMEEITWREFTYLHEPLIDLTADITLMKYKSDLLYLLELGFNDIVLEKDFFTPRHYFAQGSYVRDIFDFQEFTAPFFFFDSEQKLFGNVPTGVAFEYVSSFGIPLLDKQWNVGDVQFFKRFDSESGKYIRPDKELDPSPDTMLAKKAFEFKKRNKQYYKSSSGLEEEEFYISWYKHQKPIRFLYLNYISRQKSHREAQLMVLTAIKGSKAVLSKNLVGTEPTVRGLLLDCLIGVSRGDGDYFSKLTTRIMAGYFKLVLFFILKKIFKGTTAFLDQFLSIFVKYAGKSFRCSFLQEAFCYLYNFVSFFVLFSKVIYYSQLVFFLNSTLRNSVISSLNFFFEITWYLRFLTFLFRRHKN